MPADPRPLTTEPLALDLVNTTWIDDGTAHDLLATPDGVELWLAEHPIQGARARDARAPLIEAREAIRGVLEHPGERAARARLDEVLAKGRVRLRLSADGPAEEIEVPAPWRAAWLAARDLLRLLDEAADRIRKCSNPDCVLWFYDTSRSGTRRWCSMTGCGNRLKARRHHLRQTAGG